MTMKNRWLWFCGLMVLPLAVFAQTNSVPTPAALPKTVAEYWTLLIAGVTPLIVTGVWKLVPKIPTVVLPLMTPVLGIGLGLLINAVSKANLGWVDMASAGALAVFVREVFNQAITKRLADAATPVITTPTTPKP
jgi:hypothetical protein